MAVYFEYKDFVRGNIALNNFYFDGELVSSADEALSKVMTQKFKTTFISSGLRACLFSVR